MSLTTHPIDAGAGSTASQSPAQPSTTGGALAGAIVSSPKLAILALTLFAPHAGELATAAARLGQVPGLRTSALAALGLVIAIACGALLATALVAFLARLLGITRPDRVDGMETVSSWQRPGIAPLRPASHSVHPLHAMPRRQVA